MTAITADETRTVPVHKTQIYHKLLRADYTSDLNDEKKLLSAYIISGFRHLVTACPFISCNILEHPYDYVHMRAAIYVYVCVCVYGWMDGWMGGWGDGWMGGWM